jgi:RNA polymerase sigma-70 factor (ECF subfamily)
MSQAITTPAPEAIINDYGRLVSSICRRMIQDEETARDAAQEVWLAVMKSLPTFKGEAKLSTWIYTIAYRVVSRHARRERQYSTRYLRDYFRAGEIELPAQGPDFEQARWVREMCDKCLTGILHCLDNESRIAYIFRDMAHLSYAEIARILDKDEPAVRQNISRARRKLRHFLNNECALFNPQGTCRCRMKKHVTQVQLPQEYEKLRRTVQSVNLYRESETILPGKNYWETYL